MTAAQTVRKIADELQARYGAGYPVDETVDPDFVIYCAEEAKKATPAQRKVWVSRALDICRKPHVQSGTTLYTSFPSGRTKKLVTYATVIATMEILEGMDE